MAIEYKVSDVKAFAAHLQTLGAYVQQPTPKIVGLSKFQAIGSQDAKSLYPTIMVLLNIGYDTLRGRIYDYDIIGPAYNMMKKLQVDNEDETILETGLSNFKSALQTLAKNYANREKMKESKSKFIEFTTQFYGECFRKIVSYKGKFNDILNPKTDEQYYLLKSALYPLLEAITWISALNKGYSDPVVDYVFFNPTFRSKYSNKRFLILHDINSTKTKVFDYSMEEAINNIFTNFILNPYGTYFDKHDTNKSFEVDLILGGMDDRAFVKNQFLILEAITQNWDKLNIKQQKAFIIESGHIDEEIAREVIELVGDTNPKVREWQLKNLLSIVFETLVPPDELVKNLETSIAQKESRSNGIKVTLNSGYGIYGMATWVYGNNLIANSITTGGKIYGIKLFQQIASNRLKKERQKIKEMKEETK